MKMKGGEVATCQVGVGNHAWGGGEWVGVKCIYAKRYFFALCLDLEVVTEIKYEIMLIIHKACVKAPKLLFLFSFPFSLSQVIPFFYLWNRKVASYTLSYRTIMLNLLENNDH